MNREERLRAVLPGADDELVIRLADLPAATVADVVTALRLAHRDGRAHEVEFRRQRVRDRRKYNHIQDDQQAGATGRQLMALAKRAGGNLATLAMLKELFDAEHAVMSLAVAGLRQQGYSDAAIAEELGVTRQAVSQRFLRQPDLATGLAGTGGAS